jgi:hypothetical protein
MRITPTALALLAMVAGATDALARGAAGNTAQVSSASITLRRLQFAGSRILLSLEPESFTLTEEDIADWILRSARATTTYFGRFPVAAVNIQIEAAAGDQVTEGVAYSEGSAQIRVTVGRQTTPATLKRDSTLVHEMTHLGFPDVDDAQLWLHEGIASYIEVVGRAQALEITPLQAWARFAEELPQGLPKSGEGGLDNTQSEDRRYWGGAMFWLIADIEIRRRSNNRFGLKDALRAVLDAGGNLAQSWRAERVLAVGDAAVGVPVLSELYATWKRTPVAPDLRLLFDQLGVRSGDGGARLIDTSALAAIRREITAPPARPLLLLGPSLLREATQGR